MAQLWHVKRCNIIYPIFVFNKKNIDSIKIIIVLKKIIDSIKILIVLWHVERCNII